MQRKILLVFLVFFSACNNGKEEHLPVAKMQQVLADIHMAESYSIYVNQDSGRHFSARQMDSLAVYYQQVFQHHQITLEQFEQSLHWYKKNPAALDSVYSGIIPEMTRWEGLSNAR
jgi:hypothetical protein